MMEKLKMDSLVHAVTTVLQEASLSAKPVQLERLEILALSDALKQYGPAKMGNHTLFDALVKKLEDALEQH